MIGSQWQAETNFKERHIVYLKAASANGSL